MANLPRTPTPPMLAAAWDIVDRNKKAMGIAKLGPGLGVREIWQAMFDAAQGTEARRAETENTGSVHDGPVAKPCAQRHSPQSE